MTHINKSPFINPFAQSYNTMQKYKYTYTIQNIRYIMHLIKVRTYGD